MTPSSQTNAGAAALVDSGASLKAIAKAGGSSKAAAVTWRSGTSLPGPEARARLQRAMGIEPAAWDRKPSTVAPPAAKFARGRKGRASTAVEAPVERPDAGKHAPKLEGRSLATLRRLLTVQSARLDRALELEAKRGFVFPETTVISKDVEKLSNAIAKLEAHEDGPAPSPVCPERAAAAPAATSAPSGASAATRPSCAPTPPTVTSVRGMTVEQVEELLAQLDAARREPTISPLTLVQIATASARLLALVARLRGDGATDEVKWLRSPLYTSLKGRILAAVRSVPDAGRALAAALERADVPEEVGA